MYLVLLLVGLLSVLLLGGAGWVLFQMLCQQGRLLLRTEALEATQTATSLALQPTPQGTAAVALTGQPVEAAAPASPSSPSSLPSFTAAASVSRVTTSTELTEAEEDEGEIELTIGMATYNDFDGVYFTLQALRLYQDLEHTELLVIDNYGCEHTKNLVEGWLKGRYIRATDVVGTAAPRELVFRAARQGGPLLR